MFGLNKFKVSWRTVLAAALATAAVIGVGSAEARTVEAMKASGTLRVGIQDDNVPWGYIDSSGTQKGFDADVAIAFAKSLGVKIEFVPLAMANRIPALQTDKVDVLFACLAMTAERARTIQYSVPYAANPTFVLAAKDVKIAGPGDLSGKRVGLPRSSTMDKAVTAIAPADANLMRFDDDSTNIQALVSGQVDAIGAGQAYMARVDAQAFGKYENKFQLSVNYNGAGSRMGEQDWNVALNAFLISYMKSPEFVALYTGVLKDQMPAEFPAKLDGIPFAISK
jgi:polar amino acid transport system substrate-binding protein